MNRIVIIGGTLALLLASVTVALWFMLEKLGGVASEWRDREQRALERLRALDREFVAPARRDLDPARFPAYLRARGRAAAEYDRRLKEPSSDNLHALGTRVFMMEALADQLAIEKMGLAEYRATGARLQALIAAEPSGELSAAWKSALSNKEYPDGLPLPAAAADPAATGAEKELLEKAAAEIEASMTGDWLRPVLS